MDNKLKGAIRIFKKRFETIYIEDEPIYLQLLICSLIAVAQGRPLNIVYPATSIDLETHPELEDVTFDGSSWSGYKIFIRDGKEIKPAELFALSNYNDLDEEYVSRIRIYIGKAKDTIYDIKLLYKDSKYVGISSVRYQSPNEPIEIPIQNANLFIDAVKEWEIYTDKEFEAVTSKRLQES